MTEAFDGASFPEVTSPRQLASRGSSPATTLYLSRGTERLPPGMTVGMDTFRGMSHGSTMLRSTLYQKNLGAVSHDKGVTRTDSPISGCLLVSPTSMTRSVRDPMTGTALKFKGSAAQVTTPVQKQQLLHSRSFYLTKDVDISIQMLRNTTKVSRFTNEKVGTAGTPTGMDDSLRAFREVQAQMGAREERQAQALAAIQAAAS